MRMFSRNPPPPDPGLWLVHGGRSSYHDPHAKVNEAPGPIPGNATTPRPVAEPPGAAPPQYIIEWTGTGASLRAVAYVQDTAVDRGTSPRSLIAAGRT